MLALSSVLQMFASDKVLGNAALKCNDNFQSDYQMDLNLRM